MTDLNSLFAYPFNASKLFRKREDIKQALAPRAQQKIKVVLLSGSTIGELKELIEVFLLRFGIECEFWEGAYNGFYEEAMFARALWDFSPDWVYIHTSHKNITHFPSINSKDKEISDKFFQESEKWRNLITLFSKKGVKTIFNNFDFPVTRKLGNLDGFSATGQVKFIRKLNQFFADFGCAKNIYFNDLNYLSTAVGLDDWFDQAYWHSFRYAIAPKALPLVAASLAGIVASAHSRASS